MKISLVHTEVAELAFHREITKKGEGESGEEKAAVSINFSTLLDEVNANFFSVVFDLSLLQPRGYNMQLKYLSWFECSEKLDENFLKTPFATINAPAIAYPYLRSYVTNLVVSSGFKPTILPVINFIQFSENKEKETVAIMQPDTEQDQ